MKNEILKGEVDYDYKQDILFFKSSDREYVKSIEIDNIVLDIDTEGLILGIQIFDASKFLRMDKPALKVVPKWKFQAYIDQESIEIRLNFQVSVRNQLLEKNPIIIQRNDEKLPESEMVVTV